MKYGQIQKDESTFVYSLIWDLTTYDSRKKLWMKSSFFFLPTHFNMRLLQFCDTVFVWLQTSWRSLTPPWQDIPLGLVAKTVQTPFLMWPYPEHRASESYLPLKIRKISIIYLSFYLCLPFSVTWCLKHALWWTKWKMMRYGKQNQRVKTSCLQSTAELFPVKSSQRIDFNNDWKVITMFIGGNDICDYCKNSVSTLSFHFTVFFCISERRIEKVNKC